MESFSGRFQCHELLGQGATAQVFRATEISSGRHVALKVAHKALNRHVGFRFRWLRESAIAIRLAHPSIVPICDYGELDSRLFMAMSIAEQGVLDKVWREGVSFIEASRHLQSILKGLSYIHAHGIVHQDIKPENILLSDRAWISDFSVARTISEVMVNPKDIAGSPGWMAPEQIERAAKDIGPWTDIYAWGLMLERLLQNDPLKDFFEPLLAVCLHLDPRQRLGSAALVFHRFSAICEEIKTKDKPILYRPVFTLPTYKTTKADPFSREWPRQRPSIPRPSWVHSTAMFMAPSIQEWALIQDEIWSVAKSVVDNGVNKAVILIGEAGLGKRKLMTSLSRKLADVGLMNRYRLLHKSSPYSAGHILPIREILSPYGENSEDFISRWSERISLQFGDDKDLANEKASALAAWCGLQDSPVVDAHLGLMFFLRTIQARSDVPAACLLVAESTTASLPGGGLSLCEALLTDSFGPRPVLLLCAVDSAALQQPKVQARMARLLEMGAIQIQLSSLDDAQMTHHLSRGWGLSQESARALAPLCRGSLRRAREMIRYCAAFDVIESSIDGGEIHPSAIPQRQEDLIQRRLALALEQALDSAKALSVLHFIAFSELDVPMSMLMDHEPLMTEYLASIGLIIQRGRWAFLESTDLKRALVSGSHAPTGLSPIYRELALVWGENQTEDPLRRDVFVGSCLCFGGESIQGLSLLHKAINTAFTRREWSLAHHAAETSFQAAVSFGSEKYLLQSWILGLRISRMLESLEEMEKWLNREPLSIDLHSELWRDLHRLWLQVKRREDVDKESVAEMTKALSATENWTGSVSCHTLLAEIARRQGDWLLVDDHVSTAAFMAEATDPRWPQIWRLRAASWIHLGVQDDYVHKIDAYLGKAIGSIWRFMHGVCTKAELATRQCDYNSAALLWLRGKTLSSLTDSDALHWECMCMEAATIALSGDLEGSLKRYRATARFAKARGWSTKSQLANLFALGVQPESDAFRREMRQEPLPSMENGHIWSLLLARRHMLIDDPAGVAAWWQSAYRFGLDKEWSLSVCPSILSMLSWANCHLPAVATEMEKELSRISGANRLSKIPLYVLALSDT